MVGSLATSSPSAHVVPSTVPSDDVTLSSSDRWLANCTFVFLGCGSLLVWNAILSTLPDLNTLFGSNINETIMATFMSFKVATNFVWICLVPSRPWPVYVSSVVLAISCISIPLIAQTASGSSGIVAIHIVCVIAGCADGTIQPATFGLAAIMPVSFSGVASFGMGISGVLAFFIWILFSNTIAVPIDKVKDPEELKLALWLMFSFVTVVYALCSILVFFLMKKEWARKCARKAVQGSMRRATAGEASAQGTQKKHMRATAGEVGELEEARRDDSLVKEGASMNVAGEHLRSQTYQVEEAAMDGSASGKIDGKNDKSVDVVSEGTLADTMCTASIDAASKETPLKNGYESGHYHSPVVRSVYCEGLPTQKTDGNDVGDAEKGILQSSDSGVRMTRLQRFTAGCGYYIGLGRAAWIPLTSLCLMYLVTYTMFPNIGPMKWGTYTVAEVGAYQLGEFVGRYIPILSKYIKCVLCSKRAVLPIALVRILFIPLFMVCFVYGANSSSKVPVLSDTWFHVIMMVLLSVSQGWVVTLCLMYTPSYVESKKDKSQVSSLAVLLLLLSITIGLWLSKLFLLMGGA